MPGEIVEVSESKAGSRHETIKVFALEAWQDNKVLPARENTVTISGSEHQGYLEFSEPLVQVASINRNGESQKKNGKSTSKAVSGTEDPEKSKEKAQDKDDSILGGSGPPPPDGRPRSEDPDYGTFENFAKQHLIHPSPKSSEKASKEAEHEQDNRLDNEIKLPAFEKGDKTQGVLESEKGKPSLLSGWDGPAAQIPKGTPGFDIVTRTHAEGHAAAFMRLNKIETATLHINNPNICPPCRKLLPTMLPAGAELKIVLPNGSSETFRGNSK